MNRRVRTHVHRLPGSPDLLLGRIAHDEAGHRPSETIYQLRTFRVGCVHSVSALTHDRLLPAVRVGWARPDAFRWVRPGCPDDGFWGRPIDRVERGPYRPDPEPRGPSRPT